MRGLGSSWLDAAAYFSSASRTSPLSFCGTATSTVTSRSPWPPPRLLRPRPRTRSVRPLAVPAGTLTETAPSRVGTRSVVPSAASAYVIGTVRVRLSPRRPNSSCAPTCTVTNRSPAGPPRTPGVPLPAIRSRAPSRTPAGTRTLIVRVCVVTPVPWQSGHGSSMIWPVPRQSRHGSLNPNAPWLRLTNPLPPQVGHTYGLVPGRAPDPWQVWHVPGPESFNGSITPRTASSKPSVTSASTSCPRVGPTLRRRVVVPPVKSPPKMSPSPPPVPALPMPPVPLKRSPTSNVPSPLGNPPPANSVRASSYSLRRFSSERTSYASDTSLNLASASALPGFLSGCSSRASLRYAFLMSAGDASLATPSAL